MLRKVLRGSQNTRTGEQLPKRIAAGRLLPSTNNTICCSICQADIRCPVSNEIHVLCWSSAYWYNSRDSVGQVLLGRKQCSLLNLMHIFTTSSNSSTGAVFTLQYLPSYYSVILTKAPFQTARVMPAGLLLLRAPVAWS